ncbi:efflux transporter outer membrane subunit [Marinivivus vitaminiproducens]|uniref:efflux transporter outer membrane subunit n=1 Tax=Marinivivus vitaminiproducens TaxID=3035935 RepID=UPI00279FC44B|nr:efflux transporter outer membrane subunit [Geminicoccaceae bacterium SCSIO 64248]
MLALVGLAGCAVGPDFENPTLPASIGYREASLPAQFAAGGSGETQQVVLGRDIPGDWWTVFGSSELSVLIESALAASPDLEAAKAALTQAQENAFAADAGVFPSVQLKGGANRVGFSAESIGQDYTEVFTLSTGQLNISYPLDIIGGTRRQVEAAVAQADYQRFQLEAAYVTLGTNIVVTAIQEASLRAQIEASEAIVATGRRLLALVERQHALGSVALADVLAQRSAVARSEANLPALRQNLERQRNMLRALAGRFPSDPLEAQFAFEDLTLPGELPVSLPSALVEQRPDVRSAEAQLHSATAEVGISIANMLPQISLSGSYGRIGTENILSSGGVAIWDYGVSLTQPIFQGGKLLHQKRAAEAGLATAAARHKSVVLGAFRDVADALQALQSDAETVAAQRTVERAASESLAIAEGQYRSGSASFLTLLNAQNTYEQAKIGRVQAEANRFVSTAALYQALGGGWWNRQQADPDDQEATS